MESLDGSYAVDLQPSDECESLVKLALEIGLYDPGANGIQVISWSNINAYFNLTGMVDPWIAKVIKQLSLKYVSCYYASEAPDSVSPLSASSKDIKRQIVESQFELLFRRVNDGHSQPNN